MKNIVRLIFQHIQYLHLVNSEAAWVLVYLRTPVRPQLILNPDYLSDYLSVSYAIGSNKSTYYKIIKLIV